MYITGVSIYQLSTFVQGGNLLSAFSDHLGEIGFYLSNVTETSVLYFSHTSSIFL